MSKSIMIPNPGDKVVYQSLETDYNIILETITKVDHEENSTDVVDDAKPKRCGKCKQCKCAS
jgi:hypothetical protein